MTKEEFIEEKIKEVLAHESIQYADSRITLDAFRNGTKGYTGELIQVPLKRVLEEAWENGKHAT